MRSNTVLLITHSSISTRTNRRSLFVLAVGFILLLILAGSVQTAKAGGKGRLAKFIVIADVHSDPFYNEELVNRLAAKVPGEWPAILASAEPGFSPYGLTNLNDDKHSRRGIWKHDDFNRSYHLRGINRVTLRRLSREVSSNPQVRRKYMRYYNVSRTKKPAISGGERQSLSVWSGKPDAGELPEMPPWEGMKRFTGKRFQHGYGQGSTEASMPIR